MKCWIAWITSWNQDCQEKYQQPQICRWHHPYGRKWRGTKEPLEDERGVKKLVWNSTFEKTKIMASSPIILGGKVEAVTDFIFLGSKITADHDCGHEIKRGLLLGKKPMTKPRQHPKRRDITLLTNIHIINGMIFPVVMYGCESWIIKQAECQKIDTFELWSWRRLLRVPSTAISNQ